MARRERPRHFLVDCMAIEEAPGKANVQANPRGRPETPRLGGELKIGSVKRAPAPERLAARRQTAASLSFASRAVSEVAAVLRR